ncbi:MAG: type II toxin-antitoxin system Phd/YefM family antitoxin [Chromatiaceae bacterium]|jgi:prevent-host-death family protein
MAESSIAEAKTQLARLIHQAERGEAVHITRRGKPVAVLLSEQEYARLCRGGQSANFWDLIVEMRSDPHFESADWTAEDFNSWRYKRPAREFEWPE